jgi:hypothetical protein
MTKHKIITLEDYNNNVKKFFYLMDIKKSLKTYKLADSKLFKEKKKVLQQLLFDYFDNLNKYDVNKVVLIQRNFKKYLNEVKIKTQGPGILDKSKCSNQEDFYTLDSIDDIEDKYFFSYKTDGHIYFFDIRSFNKLVGGDCKNPYTREKIPQYAIDMFKKRKKQLKINKIIINEFEKCKMTKEQLFNADVLNIFQKIDMLNIAAGGTNTCWFTDLNILQLKMLYKVLEDIWNYRAELTLSKKLEIVPSNNMFSRDLNEIYYMNKKRELQYIILTEMDKLLSSASNIEDKMTGGYFILTSLVEISPTCMEALPWLIQHN